MSSGILFLVLLGDASFEAACQPAHHSLSLFAFAAQLVEPMPVKMRADRWRCDAVDIQSAHDGFGLARVGVENLRRARQVIEHLRGEAKGGDADAEAAVKTAQAIGKCFVNDGSGVDQLTGLGPLGDGECLEKVLAIGLK